MWWEHELEAAGLYTFAPLPVIRLHATPRLSGDGPTSATDWLTVARPRRRVEQVGSRPGFYSHPGNEPADGGRRARAHPGGKPLALTRAIVGDYTNPGDVVVDPCAGGATTLIAAAELGCTAIGAELDPDTYAKAQKRIAKGYTPLPHPRAHKSKAKPKQGALW